MEDNAEVVIATPEVGQMGDTRRVLATALSEPDQTYDIPENKFLKENWITEVIAKLDKPVSGNTERIVTISDANLAIQPERGFAATYLSHLGSKIDVMELKKIVNGEIKLPVIKREELDFPVEPRLAWVEDSSGRRSLISTTKIDGVQVELDMHAVGNGPETTGFLHPILHISTK